MSVLPQPTISAEWTPPPPPRPPSHLELPESDGAIAENFLELPQSMLLTGSIWPVLQQRHPDKQFALGHDSGIYWKWTDPPLLGCKAPDWFYVPGVPPDLDGHYRRSYVLWQEGVVPLLLIEYVSKDGAEERDRTPMTGKFWVYEQGIRAPYYAIYEPYPGRVEVYNLVSSRYRPLPPNERGHFPIEELGLELGIWHGFYFNTTQHWLRWWDAGGNMLPSEEERAEKERLSAEQEKQRAEQESERAQRFAARLGELGVDPDQAE